MSNIEKREQLYEGKAKKVYATSDPDLVIVDYKDDATAFNGEKRGTILNKGIINNLVTNHMMQLLEKEGIPTHFVKEISDRETIVKRVKIIPLEVIVRNIIAGSLSKRLGQPEGIKLQTTVLEYSYKDDDLGDPMVNDYHIMAMEWATREELDLLADEISPDTCRFWDMQTKEKLDKDRFRRDMGGEEDAYKEILKRLMGKTI